MSAADRECQSIPGWVENSDPCPVDGCTGRYWFDVGGHRHDPQTVVRSSCRHDLRRCANCNDCYPSSELTAYSWRAERPLTIRLCRDCHSRETYDEWVPDWAPPEYKGGGGA